MTTYLGITIGPIYKTLQMVRKTRHLWAASYTFAYLMKEIVREINDKSINEKYSREWLKPALGIIALDQLLPLDDRQEKRINGVGIFPDHLIFSINGNKEVDDIKALIFKVIDQYSDEVTTKLSSDSDFKKEMSKYLRDYFQIYWVCKTLPNTANPILEISDLLNAVELQKAFASKKEDYLFKFFEVVTDSFLTKEAFGGKHNFSSIPEIALTAHLKDEKEITKADGSGNKVNCKAYIESKVDKDNEELSDEYIKWVHEFRKQYADQNEGEIIDFFTAHKYIAIVQADGDNIGKLLKALPRQKWGDFSQALTNFSVDAADQIKEFGGLPVYVGGDEALFFAPVIINGEKNIFTLLRDLDSDFRARFVNFENTGLAPSLSFGLSISYYKYPLYEALKLSGKLLHVVAKKGGLSNTFCDIETKKEITETIKNNIVFQLRKHSGSSFSGIIHLDKDQEFSVLDDFIRLFKLNLSASNQALRSIIYHVVENNALLQAIAQDKDSLANWLENSFNEEIHKTQKTEYLEAVADLINKIYIHAHRYPKKLDEEAYKSPDRIVYGLLKTIAFLTTTEG